MQSEVRNYLNTGIAALGVGIIALSPVQPVSQQLNIAQHRVIEDLAVDLAAMIDPITPIITTITTTFTNIGNLGTLYAQQPFPFLQTIFANVATYLGELTSGGAGLIPGQIIDNVRTLFSAPFDQGATVELDGNAGKVPVALGEYLSTTAPLIGNSPESTNLVFLQSYAPNAVTCTPGDDCFYQAVAPITNFFNNHASGLLLGLLGPILSPVVQLGKSVNAIVGSLRTGDFIGAVNELINIPTNLVNAFLNGAGITDLTPIAKQFINLPEPLAGLGVNLGGLLNAVPRNGSLIDPEDSPTAYTGGTAMDALTVVLDTGSGPFIFSGGLPIGLAGSLIGTSQFIAGKMRVTPPGAASVKAVRAAATAAPAESSAGESAAQAENDSPAPASTRGKSRAKAAASNAESRSGARARRGDA